MRELLIEKDVSLAPLTTFRIGGRAKYFVRVNNIEELKAVPTFLSEREGLPIFILGGGSNILVGDEGFSGLVIKMELKGVEWKEEKNAPSTLLRAGAGEVWDELVGEVVSRGFSGMENLSGIPGSVGGSVVQNIGAYGAELKDILHSVEVFNLNTGHLETLSNEECLFDYRHSVFKTSGGDGRIIIAATLRLNKRGLPNLTYRDLEIYFKNRPAPTAPEIRQAVLNIRQSKFPPLSEVGTAGSFFKNPIVSREKFRQLSSTYPDMPNYFVDEDNVKVPAAWLLDKVGNFKGVREENVGSWQNQALVLVNYGKASAKEIKALANKMQKIIQDKTGIALEPEVGFIGE